jgi:HlyD family secretion protein
VGGNVVLEWQEGSRQQVRSPRPATVAEFYVTSGQHVEVGDPIVRLTSRELDHQIADLEAQIDLAQRELAEAEAAQARANADVLEAAALAAATDQRASRLNQRQVQVQQGQSTPDLQEIEAERDRLALQLQQDRNNWQRYDDLYQQGAVSREQRDEREIQFLNTQQQLAAVEAQLQAARLQLADRAADESSTLQYQQARVVGRQQVAAVTTPLSAQRAAIARKVAHLATLQQQQADLIVTADQTGQILDEDLDLLVGQDVTPETPLVRIAQLDQLTANVEVKEEELNYFENGDEVTFRPTSAKLTTYQAVVEKRLPDVEPDATQQRRVATVRVVIDNEDQLLMPGSGGYAKIFSEWIPLYQRVGREILKLVPSRFL